MRVLLFFLFCFLFLQQNPTLSHSLFSSLVSFEELFFFFLSISCLPNRQCEVGGK